jgi:hypothetical protein
VEEIDGDKELLFGVAIRLGELKLRQFAVALSFTAYLAKSFFQGTFFVVAVSDDKFIISGTISLQRPDLHRQVRILESAVVDPIAFDGEAVRGVFVEEIDSDKELLFGVAIRLGELKLRQFAVTLSFATNLSKSFFQGAFFILTIPDDKSVTGGAIPFEWAYFDWEVFILECAIGDSISFDGEAVRRVFVQEIDGDEELFFGVAI